MWALEIQGPTIKIKLINTKYPSGSVDMTDLLKTVEFKQQGDSGDRIFNLLFLRLIRNSVILQVKTIILMMLLSVFFSCQEFEFKQEDLDKLQLTNKCAKCYLSKANLNQAFLSEANLSFANLRETSLIRTDLSFADLRGTLNCSH